MNLAVLVMLVALLAYASDHSGAQDAERVIPVFEEPRHRLVFQAEATRILHLQVYPGDTSLFHTHAEPILYVAFKTAETSTQNLGGEWSPPRNQLQVTPPPAAVLSTTSYVEKPVTHRIRNAGKELFELVAVLNSTAGDESHTPEAAGFTGKPELANRWYRAYRFTMPGGQTLRHQHLAPVVLVQTSLGGAMGSGRRFYGFNRPTDWGYFDMNEGHELRNSGNAPVEFIEIEVRQPGK